MNKTKISFPIAIASVSAIIFGFVSPVNAAKLWEIETIHIDIPEDPDGIFPLGGEVEISGSFLTSDDGASFHGTWLQANFTENNVINISSNNGDGDDGGGDDGDGDDGGGDDGGDGIDLGDGFRLRAQLLDKGCIWDRAGDPEAINNEDFAILLEYSLSLGSSCNLNLQGGPTFGDEPGVKVGVGWTFKFNPTFNGSGIANLIETGVNPEESRFQEPLHVPEPATILGSATALGFGALLKRKNSKKQNKS